MLRRQRLVDVRLHEAALEDWQRECTVVGRAEVMPEGLGRVDPFVAGSQCELKHRRAFGLRGGHSEFRRFNLALSGLKSRTFADVAVGP